MRAWIHLIALQQDVVFYRFVISLHILYDTGLLSVITDRLMDAEVMIGDPPIIGPFIYQLPKLKWFQSTFAGIDGINKHVNKENVPAFTLTRFGGVFGQPMAEYVLLHIIAKERKLLELFKNQELHVW